MTRRWLRAVACALVGVLVAAQMAIAAYVCPAVSPAMAMAMAVAVASTQMPTPHDSSMNSMSHCEDMGGAMDPSSPNLCAEYCKYGQQSDKAPTLNAPAAVLVALYAKPLVPEPAPPPRFAAAAVSARVAASPPHTLLHCVFRI